jgi:hypothetical protein
MDSTRTRRQNANTVCFGKPTHKQPYQIRETDVCSLMSHTARSSIAICRYTFFNSKKYVHDSCPNPVPFICQHVQFWSFVDHKFAYRAHIGRYIRFSMELVALTCIDGRPVINSSLSSPLSSQSPYLKPIIVTISIHHLQAVRELLSISTRFGACSRGKGGGGWEKWHLP